MADTKLSGSSHNNAHHTMDPYVGATIGNCTIVEKINEGGTAFIYRAHNTRFNLDRVVKILKPSLKNEEDFYDRFHQEAQLTARLDHPNILRVYDTGEVDGHFYIEMEYLHGQTLRDYMISNPRISEREILTIAQQLTQALLYAHTIDMTNSSGEKIHGILHRDIKPENIMITTSKMVKLMDFGAAKPMNITSTTVQGTIIGTYHYMSPEQLAGAALDIRSDFFSLGIVLYELFTGQKPFMAENIPALSQKINECRYEKVRKLRPSVTSLTEEFIDKLLSRNPDLRPASEKEILEDLQVCMQSYSGMSVASAMKIPFLVRRYFSSIALVCSCCALVLSIIAVHRSFTGTKAEDVAVLSETSPLPLLERAKELERNGRINEAVRTFLLVPSTEKGGLANEYLEAQVRLAKIYLKQQTQYDKARKILEKLKKNYSDPAIDAYLGEAYFRLGMFDDAKDRFDAALSSQTGSVIPFTTEFKRNMIFFQASSLDKKTSLEKYSRISLIDALKAWNYYMDIAKCSSRQDQECEYAHKRLEYLENIDKSKNR
jgi:tetratricopeptide (TPR) repeat protein/tRNA A-37 threonylcarbamoyl transferase component Bud32